MRALPLLLVIAACTIPVDVPPAAYLASMEPNGPLARGRQLAIDCLQLHPETPSYPEDGFTFWVAPGASIDEQGHTSPTRSLPFSGITDFTSQRVYVVENSAHSSRIWGHEYLHVLTRIRDHPPIFTRCRL
jgi:hypothetical protein